MPLLMSDTRVIGSIIILSMNSHRNDQIKQAPDE